MRTIMLNGYIDEEVWYGDEITPQELHEHLYGKNGENSDDVRIVLNSYGGNCNAATRMYDDVRNYPGTVHLIVSGTAASAASVLSLSANRVEMTPGSLFMIHDPSVMAWGNEQDLNDAIHLLQTCKEAILNIYERRSHLSRAELSDMMKKTTWMDARQALAEGFIDGIIDEVPSSSSLFNSGQPHTVDRKDAEAKVQAWLDRTRPQRPHSEKCVHDKVPNAPAEPKNKQPENTGTPVIQLRKRLDLLMPKRR